MLPHVVARGVEVGTASDDRRRRLGDGGALVYARALDACAHLGNGRGVDGRIQRLLELPDAHPQRLDRVLATL